MERTGERTGRLDRGDGVELAWALLPGALLPGAGPTIVFLPGYNSDMAGAKALALRELCGARGWPLLRLDYSGHGASGGAFTDGTIGRWKDDAQAVIEHAVSGPLLLVGSSMGGWIALLLAAAMADRITGLVGIAAAPDFTERLMWQSMTPAERGLITTQGYLDVPSEYGAPYRVTRGLIEDGRRHLLLDAPIPLACPVRLLQGQQDADVPWETAVQLAARVHSADVQVTLIKDGDHRLSRPQDLALLTAVVGMLRGQDGS